MLFSVIDIGNSTVDKGEEVEKRRVETVTKVLKDEPILVMEFLCAVEAFLCHFDSFL